MQRIQIHGADDVRLDEVPIPEPGPADAVVRVAACGICGSDLGYIELGGVAGPGDRPMALGHEVAGIVEAVGGDVSGLEPGARVVVNPIAASNMIGNGGPEGGLAPYLLVRNAMSDRCLVALPDALPLGVAALAEPLAVGMRSVERAEIESGQKVVIFGAGPIGLAAVATLHHRGVEDVVAVDLSTRRLAIASALGARHCLNPATDDVWARICELHGRASVMGAPMAASDAYIEASGAGAVVRDVLAHARSEARLCVVALHRKELPLSLLLLMMKQLTLVGSMAYPNDWAPVIEMLVAQDLSPMITHRFALHEFERALAVARDPGAGGKVVIEFS